MKEPKNIVKLSFQLDITVYTDLSEGGLRGYFYTGPEYNTTLSDGLMNTLRNYFVLSEHRVSEMSIELKKNE